MTVNDSQSTDTTNPLDRVIKFPSIPTSSVFSTPVLPYGGFTSHPQQGIWQNVGIPHNDESKPLSGLELRVDKEMRDCTHKGLAEPG